MNDFERAHEAMKRLQRNYTVVRINNNMGSLSRDAMKDLRDLVEELVVVAYGPAIKPESWSSELWEARKSEIREARDAAARAGRACSENMIYTLHPSAIPPGFALVDEAQLKSELLAPVFDDRTKQIIELRIRDMFKRIAR